MKVSGLSYPFNAAVSSTIHNQGVIYEYRVNLQNTFFLAFGLSVQECAFFRAVTGSTFAFCDFTTQLHNEFDKANFSQTTTDLSTGATSASFISGFTSNIYQSRYIVNATVPIVNNSQCINFLTPHIIKNYSTLYYQISIDPGALVTGGDINFYVQQSFAGISFNDEYDMNKYLRKFLPNLL
jgi:hypothetical protein